MNPSQCSCLIYIRHCCRSLQKLFPWWYVGAVGAVGSVGSVEPNGMIDMRAWSMIRAVRDARSAAGLPDRRDRAALSGLVLHREAATVVRFWRNVDDFEFRTSQSIKYVRGDRGVRGVRRGL